MKKITLLLLLISVSFAGFSQGPWDFTTSVDTWTGSGGTFTHSGVANDPAILTYTLASASPKILQATANVNASGGLQNICAITIKNNSVNSYLRVSHLKTGGTGRRYENQTISTNDTAPVTYYFDMTNANWGSDNGGIENDIQVHIKFDSGTTNSVDGSLEFYKIEFIEAIPTTLQESYTFDLDGDTEGFSATNGSISGPTTGILTFTPVVNKSAKLVQSAHHVDATTNKWIHITLTNNSTLNDQLRLVGGGAASTMPMLVSGAGGEVEKTYSFDMSGVVGWTGNQVFTIGIGSLANGKAQDAGTILLNSVQINSTLSVNDVDFRDDASITLYPNPVNDVFRINSPLAIEKVEVFNLLGQKTMTVNTTTVDASGLSKGVYMIKVYQENDIISTKRFIKQ
ncbi:MAG: hypothetical protein COB73_07555 [Flavobacteriaceae bacterium]|nr:MAG: hypothetical protein COB73_07555 [Flavobacteriaceae bacterium]